MKDLSLNIKFSYRYRNYENYKQYKDLVIANPDHLPFSDIQSIIEKTLFEDKNFYASEWKVPDLHFEKWDAS